MKSYFHYHKSKFGFAENKSEIEVVLFESGGKLISKIYKILLKWYMEQELKESYDKMGSKFQMRRPIW